jgi:hypothetical protein
MIAVEVGHAHVMKFLPLSCEFFLGEKCGDVLFILCKLMIESKNVELFCTQFNSCL